MRKLIFSAFIVAIATLFACSKDESVEIPTSLTDSIWCSTINPDTFEQTIVEFIDSENAVLSVVKRGYGADQVISKAEYSYTYNSPDITLMPKTLVDPKLTGKAVKLEGAYIYLHLTSNIGDTYNLTQQADKDQTIWK